jgi:hypothetical protein
MRVRSVALGRNRGRRRAERGEQDEGRVHRAMLGVEGQPRE